MKKICYTKIKSKGPRPYVVFNNLGQAVSNFKNLKELRGKKRFKNIKKCTAKELNRMWWGKPNWGE